jgi:EamA domain-containing membrane protein RarD
MKRGRPLGFYLSVGATSIVALVLFNVAADRLPVPGLATLRDYAIRRNG